MLVLTRKPGEGFLIGGEIEVVVLESVGGLVRIGVQAPRQVPIVRNELRSQVLDENRRAASVKLDLPELVQRWAPLAQPAAEQLEANSLPKAEN